VAQFVLTVYLNTTEGGGGCSANLQHVAVEDRTLHAENRFVRLLTTTAIMPPSDLTFPRSAFDRSARGTFPVTANGAPRCCTTGLTKGSRRTARGVDYSKIPYVFADSSLDSPGTSAGVASAGLEAAGSCP